MTDIHSKYIIAQFCPPNELDNIIEQLLQPVKVATAVGSLVTSGDTNRPTESSVLKKENSKSPSFSMAGF